MTPGLEHLLRAWTAGALLAFTASPAMPQALAPITTTLTGEISIPADRPVALEYVDSPKLTALLKHELSGRGVALAGPDGEDPVAVRVRGLLQLTGKRTARIPIAELAEKGTLVELPDPARTLAPVDLVYTIAAGRWLDSLVQSGQISAPSGAFLMLEIVGQVTGARDWFNTAVGGDRRGICLVNCEHWDSTRQTALHIIEIGQGGATRRAELRSELRAGTLQPGRVVSAGLAAVVDALAGRDAPSSRIDRANTSE